MDFIEKNKLTLIASCDKILDVSLDAIEQLQVEFPDECPENMLTIEDFKKTVQKTELIKKRIVNDEEFTREEFIILGAIMSSNLTILSTHAERFNQATKLMKGLIDDFTVVLKTF